MILKGQQCHTKGMTVSPIHLPFLSHYIKPNRSVDCYVLIRFLFVICPAAFRLQWNLIAHSRQQDICSQIEAVFIITLMTDSG